MSTLAVPCDIGVTGEVTITTKLLVNGVEYLPARSFYRHRKNQPVSISLSGTGKLFLRRGDIISVQVSFSSSTLTYTIGVSQLSIQKLRLW